MAELLEQDAILAKRFIHYLLARQQRIEQDLIDHLLNSSEKWLARTLWLLSEYSKDDKVPPILEKIKQDTLAEMVGTTRSRVNFFMNKFRKLGFIHYNGRIEGAEVTSQHFARLSSLRGFQRWPRRSNSFMARSISSRAASEEERIP